MSGALHERSTKQHDCNPSFAGAPGTRPLSPFLSQAKGPLAGMPWHHQALLSMLWRRYLSTASRPSEVGIPYLVRCGATSRFSPYLSHSKESAGLGTRGTRLRRRFPPRLSQGLGPREPGPWLSRSSPRCARDRTTSLPTPGIALQGLEFMFPLRIPNRPNTARASTRVCYGFPPE